MFPLLRAGWFLSIHGPQQLPCLVLRGTISTYNTFEVQSWVASLSQAYFQLLSAPTLPPPTPPFYTLCPKDLPALGLKASALSCAHPPPPASVPRGPFLLLASGRRPSSARRRHMARSCLFGGFASTCNFSLFCADSLRFSCKLSLRRFLLRSPLKGPITITGAAFFDDHPSGGSLLSAVCQQLSCVCWGCRGEGSGLRTHQGVSGQFGLSECL